MILPRLSATVYERTGFTAGTTGFTAVQATLAALFNGQQYKLNRLKSIVGSLTHCPESSTMVVSLHVT
ncbi:hypothetical protein WCT94_02630 [Pectobacterium sp. 1950-15]|uniref:hypothetical protein n=1 Tax=Pectobacterium sp. 1950-15 TaxID=3128982 RepID=UPI00301A79F7